MKIATLIFISFMCISYSFVTDINMSLLSDGLNVFGTLLIAFILCLVSTLPRKNYVLFLKYRKWVFALGFLCGLKLVISNLL